LINYIKLDILLSGINPVAGVLLKSMSERVVHKTR
jgi:hypothetical protein